MGIFQKVGDWWSDKTDRYSRTDMPGAARGYYASDDSEKAYGKLGRDVEGKEPGRDGSVQALDVNIDPKGRVPYKSRETVEAEQAALEAEYQRRVQEEQAQALMRQQQAYQAASSAQMGFSGAQGSGYPPMQRNMPTQQQRPMQAPPTGQSRQVVFNQPAQGAPQRQPRSASQSPLPNNVVPFPGGLRASQSPSFVHTEYIVMLRSRSECKDVIEFIKTNASVFLNMEFIASDNERQRCVDMLSGAAYTLGCLLNKISPRGIYLISSPLVQLIVDPATQKFNTVPDMHGYPRKGNEGSPYAMQRPEPGIPRGAYPPMPQASQRSVAGEQGQDIPQSLADGRYAAYQGVQAGTARYPHGYPQQA